MVEYTTQEIDTRFNLLSEYERRCLIQFLQKTEGDQAELSEIVSHLSKQDPVPSDPDSVEITLRHTHLPKLDSTGVVEFDSRSGTVRYYEDELLHDVLRVTPETHLPSQ